MRKLRPSRVSSGIDEVTELPVAAVVNARRAHWQKRILLALLSFLFVVVAGGVSVYVAGEGAYGIFQSLYFSLITVSTVGYGELPQLASHEWARAVSATTIICGLVVLAYFQSTLTAFFLEGAFRKAFRRRKMDKQIAQTKDHFILVGCGRVGIHVAAELDRAKPALVIIEKDLGCIQHLESELGRKVLYVEGDATEDEVLIAAGINRAAGMVTTLSLDRDNLFVTLSARTLNPQLRIIAKVGNAHNEGKLLRAGASTVVSPQHIGGVRLANELMRPQVTEFVDQMLDMPQGITFQELEVPAGKWAGKTVAEAKTEMERDLIVIALRESGGTYRFNPPDNTVLEEGMNVIVLGR